MKIIIIVLQVYLCTNVWSNKPCDPKNVVAPTPDPIHTDSEINLQRMESIILEVQAEARKLQPFRISTSLQIAEVKDACLSGKNSIASCRKTALKTVKELQNALLKAEKARREEERLRLQRAKLSRSKER